VLCITALKTASAVEASKECKEGSHCCYPARGTFLAPCAAWFWLCVVCWQPDCAVLLPPPQVYYYPGFHAGRDGPKMSQEVVHNLTRPTAWEAVMRIRCSRGLKISSFHGHFFNRRWEAEPRGLPAAHRYRSCCCLVWLLTMTGVGHPGALRP
jgi:hypothetical protein